MKILAVSDIESKFFYDYYSPGKLKDFDLIIGCGDLEVAYLEFLVTMANCPLLYIHGNHDDHFKREPEGCVCIDDDIFEFKGVRIMGLGGCFRYRDGKYMYTEHQMKSRIRKLKFKFKHKSDSSEMADGKDDSEQNEPKSRKKRKHKFLRIRAYIRKLKSKSKHKSDNAEVPDGKDE